MTTQKVRAQSRSHAKPIAKGDGAATAPDASHRLASLDAYRGFVILMMIFVNYVEGIPNVSSWLKHAAGTEDRFTLPDLVFPGFLLMVGMAIPLAFAGKLDQPWIPFMKKVLWRTAVLLAAGVLYENAWRYDSSILHIPKSVFYTLFYASLIAIMLTHPKKKPWMTWAGVGVMALLAILFRGKIGDGFTTSYLEHTWWGILGLIGWSYLVCSIVYKACKGNGTVIMGAIAFGLALYMGDRGGRLDWIPKAIRDFVAIGAALGSTAANAMIGVLVGRWFLAEKGGHHEPERAVHMRRIQWIALYSAGLILAALLLRPYNGGISKIGATASFTLITAGINLVAFLAFYVLMDVMKWKAWAALLIPIGTNALLAYIVPDVWLNLMELVHLDELWFKLGWPFLESGGMAGLVNAAIVTLAMVALTWVGGRFGLRLKI